MLRQLGQAHPESLTTQEPLDPGHGTGPLLLESFQIPVQMAMILGLDRGHLDYLPHVALARVIAHQHAEQLAHVQPIALRPTMAPVDLNGGGIHHLIRDHVVAKPMQPEAFRPAS